MIEFEEVADIFESGAQTLVCPVNTMGVMGAGLALVFKIRFPGLLKAYKKACRDGVFQKEGIFVYDYSPTRKILCFPTKRHWAHPSKLIWIDQGLRVIAKDFGKYGITSLAIPAIGCGKGQLKWEDVSPLIDQYLDPLDLKVGVYLPFPEK